jgi:hypothetical protein
MANGFWGGSGIKYVFRMNDAGTALFQVDGTTAATTLAHASMKYGATSGDFIVESTDESFDENGALTFKVSHTCIDAGYLTFEEVVKASTTSSVTKNEKIDETGRKIGGSANAGGTKWLIVNVGASNGTKRYVTCAVMTAKKSSGGLSMKAGDIMSTTDEFTSTKIDAAYTVADAMLDDAYFATSQTVIIPTDGWKRSLLNKEA